MTQELTWKTPQQRKQLRGKVQTNHYEHKEYNKDTRSTSRYTTVKWRYVESNIINKVGTTEQRNNSYTYKHMCER